ncbi:hypothetical protein GOEFS_091_00250 [Gordonia effusa NBRC 100432]|uniref:Mce-associated membrane protein n=1 Tax=Gordonia effusa NBRC 100432 TaxID=1077974 RepID=H0R382_9ACTN|nr:hypothetical protein [Gordonia effusa]GAB19533.1 hypothetical protein GOEFS_091_00250 [Gordonia effusa NBRC 100432]
MTTGPDDSQRLVVARAELVKSTRATRLAAIAARDAFRRRARRRRRQLTIAIVTTVIVALSLAIMLVVIPFRVTAARDAGQRDDAVLTAATSAITTMLSADPKHAEQYADSVIAVSTAGQRDRLRAGRQELIGEIAGQEAVSTGVVLSAGLITDPSDTTDATAEVLLVAEATNPALIGGDPKQKRMPIAVTMRSDGGTWKIAKAGLR